MFNCVLNTTLLQIEFCFIKWLTHLSYNELPNEIKKCEQYSTAVNRLRKYFIDKTIATALTMS